MSERERRVLCDACHRLVRVEVVPESTPPGDLIVPGYECGCEPPNWDAIGRDWCDEP